MLVCVNSGFHLLVHSSWKLRYSSYKNRYSSRDFCDWFITAKCNESLWSFSIATSKSVVCWSTVPLFCVCLAVSVAVTLPSCPPPSSWWFWLGTFSFVPARMSHSVASSEFWSDRAQQSYVLCVTLVQGHCLAGAASFCLSVTFFSGFVRSGVLIAVS